MDEVKCCYCGRLVDSRHTVKDWGDNVNCFECEEEITNSMSQEPEDD